MVTLLDAGIAQYFRIIFTVILIFVIMYGLLSWRKPLGENTGLYSLIAFAISILSVSSKSFLVLINFLTPWFFIFIFIGFFIIFILMMFGLKEKDLTAGATPQMRTWVIIFTVVILLFGLGTAFGQDLLESGSTQETTTTISTGQTTGNSETGTVQTDSADFSTNLANTLFHPKVLGMIVILLVGAFAMFMLTRGQID